MKPETAQALRDIDRAFYRDCAEDFDRTRGRPWSGFDRVLAHCPDELTVLDVGCGNGRFAARLAQESEPRRIHGYLGVDGSAPLLARARQKPLPFPARFEHYDLLDDRPAPWVQTGTRYDLVVLFAVLHHIPGREKRAALVNTLADAVAPGGRLALSLFRYDRSERMLARRVPASTCAALLPEADSLEPGDHLLPFGHTGHLRYCHLFDDGEVEAHCRHGELTLLEHFAPDSGGDRLNDYVVLGNPR